MLTLADFRGLRVAGTLPLTSVGIIAKLSGALADAGVALLPIATHDTDHFFIPDSDLERARAALQSAGHSVTSVTQARLAPAQVACHPCATCPLEEPRSGSEPMSLRVLALAGVLPVSGPRLPYVANPACPFECCQYGRWTARVSLRVRPRIRELRDVAFTIAAGDSFTALEGEVWVNRPGLVMVQRRIPIYEGEGAQTMLAPGARLLLLDYLGEGGWNAWTRGRRVGTNQEDWGDSLVQVVRWPDFEWWVHVRTLDGRTGWILVTDSRSPEDSVLPVDGADGCG